ncbi:hypothetical protein MATL_G00074420 [Megalops atlanticus]|uniref:Uncharacterized protein n=1 Tax=Megalops atlanticus TaxID=7932 RepID=A0A9D3T8D8_MEGAT|nr:hypothetical protein MATL_G00074420 [Megalops atlanticus]
MVSSDASVDSSEQFFLSVSAISESRIVGDVHSNKSKCRTMLVNSWTCTSLANALRATESSALRTMPPSRSTSQRLTR